MTLAWTGLIGSLALLILLTMRGVDLTYWPVFCMTVVVPLLGLLLALVLL